ncbi:MAG: ribosomal RNA small subunit methyltransferase A [Deferribacteres bacterium]|nr:ribosomal RNA small subunit methyltransferase A [candidate division KSB1 bacterium]MCB9512272.1 ribosomal RNA small subunit methyltransferase A [Deferribacteres bacterium]
MIQDLRSFPARKSLGQNFLHDENVVRKIVAAILPNADQRIVEIGPGFGVLTAHLLASGCQYTGIEIDERLVPALQEKYSDHSNFTLHHADFRTFDLRRISTEPASLRLVGNIPYHITSSIIFTAFEHHQLIRDMVLMVQREVAERIVASPGSKAYGILSVISQTFAQPKFLFTVSPNVFIPRPDVESAIVLWDFSQKKQPPPCDPSFFSAVIKKAFGQRRKTLRNSLKSYLAELKEPFPEPELLQKRPEALPVETLIEIANKLQT